jgi:hypothetical protein
VADASSRDAAMVTTPTIEGEAASMDPAERPLVRLSRPQFWGIFAISISIFLFATGPVWRHPWRIGVLNDAILWSYLPLPLLVAGALAYRRALTLRGFFLDALELTLLKYSVTFGLSLVLWSIQRPPEEPFVFHAPRIEARATPAAKLTVLDPARLGTVRGVVVDGSGAPVANALVFVSAGLEEMVFAPPAKALELTEDGTGVSPRLAAAMVGQRVEARSIDGQLHTLVATAAGSTLFNVPLLPAGVVRAVDVAEPHGLVELRCTVHPNERHAVVGFFSNPFFALTGPDGRYAFEGVPATKITVSVSRDGRALSSTAVTVEPRGEVESNLQAP